MKIYNVGPDELSKYALNDIDIELDWLVVFYESYSSYEGGGEAVGYADGKLHFQDLGHCSCYGPMEGGFNVEHSVEDFRESLDSVHGYIEKSVVEAKVLELLG